MPDSTTVAYTDIQNATFRVAIAIAQAHLAALPCHHNAAAVQIRVP
ncbi:hypothetical protein EYZ11_008536 [Aspergillus tanneri]|uniref:Uncharacterized protein n=1 Tax=Aspergillus tanneri TaxID=1220188 RepID=A0A4S3JAA7_9EURO|nr:hypothetical protein EYZ11_008536 [Aspergillus tanneri]